jgi:DNA-directed RNA polymerase specialized sigma24 family protein
MASKNFRAFPQSIEQIFNQGSLIGMEKGQLLRQHGEPGDKTAFEVLVARHGPIVLSVCRRMRYDPREVEDAFQATFLVLLRRAGSLGSTDPLGPWLHSVAYRVAARVRSNAARRGAEEHVAARPEATDFACDVERHKLWSILDEEIRRLPEK